MRIHQMNRIIELALIMLNTNFPSVQHYADFKELSRDKIDEDVKTVSVYVETINVGQNYEDTMHMSEDVKRLLLKNAMTPIPEKYNAYKKTFLLLGLLSIIEKQRGYKNSIVDDLMKIFPSDEDAVEFITRFYNYTNTKLKLEALSEISAPYKSKLAESLIKQISRHVGLICAETTKKDFKRLLNYVEVAAEKLNLLFDKKVKILDQKTQAGILKQKIIGLFSDENESAAGGAASSTDIVKKWNNKLDTAIKYLVSIMDPDVTQGQKDLSISDKDTLVLIEVLLEIAKHALKAKGLGVDDIQTLFDIGVEQSSIEAMTKLTAVKSDEIMPDVLVQDDDFFICKLSYDDVRGPFLGMLTGCCQSIGSNGETSAIYGYTQPNSCFYVMFKKEKKGQKIVLPVDTKLLKSRNVVAQTWAWREPSKSSVIMFDSDVPLVA